MDSIPLVKFDIRGTEPVNTITGEKWKLTDKTLNWYLPDGSPFFGEAGLVVMRDQRGALMRRDRDYYVEGEFVPFCNITGRSICSYIRLSDAIVLNNDFVTIDYQSLGAYFVPRSNLEEWIYMMNAGKIPIPWSKVFGVPPTLPPEYHTHNIKTEISDWFDFTQFFIQLKGIRMSRDYTFNDKLTVVVDDAYDKLYDARDDQLNRLQLHDGNYHNPHIIGAPHLLLGNVDNFATATPAEDLAGVAADKFSTPYGVVQLAKTYVPDTDKAMLSGIMPISSFGGESFIPPNISGSFEGLGSVSDCSAICLEDNGLLMILTNHNDGRSEGLYFSYVENYNKADAKYVYSAFKYSPASLTAIGINPTAIVAGSNHKVIMVGLPGTNNWYVAITNGTLNPASHAYVKCDMTNVIALYGGTTFSSHDKSTVHFMGDWLLLVQSTGIGSDEKHTFFRAPVASIIAGTPVTWTRLDLTFADYDGVAYTNSTFWKPMVPAQVGGKWTRNGPWTYRQPVTTLNKSGRTASLSCANPNASGSYLLQILLGSAGVYNDGAGTIINITVIMSMGYSINPATGVMTLLNKTPAYEMGFTDSTQAEKNAYLNDYYAGWYNPTIQSNSASIVVLPSGETVCATIEDGNDFPAIIEVYGHTGKTTDAALLAGGLWNAVAPPVNRKYLLPQLRSPLLSGTFPGTMTFEPDGELYGAMEQATNNRKTYLRLVTGGYQARAGITNLKLPNLQARPLSNAVFETNLTYTDGVIGMTGSAADLVAGGVEMGSTSFSTCGWSSYQTTSNFYPRNNALKAPAGNNVLQTFPRTTQRVLDNVGKKATYTGVTFYGFRQAFVDKLKTFIPAEFQNTKYWAFSLHMLGAENGGMFTGMNVAMAVIHFIDAANTTIRTQLVLFRPVVEAPNADHPGVYLISDVTVLDTPPHFRNGVNVKINDVNFILSTQAHKPRGFFNVYRDNGKLKVFFVSPYSTVTSATVYTKLFSTFDIDLATNKVTGTYGQSSSWSQNDPVMMVPKVGMTDLVLTGTVPDTGGLQYPVNIYAETGGAASIFRKTNPDTSFTYYLGGSAYPETGWSLFFQDNIAVMINGAAYRVPGGSIDLRDIDAAPQNKTYYVYVTIEDDLPRYLLSILPLRKSGSMMRVATVVTNASSIVTITREQPFMVGDLLLSYTREGGIIPMSSGFPQDEGSFVFVHNGELLA
jgi:hypothetical protein